MMNVDEGERESNERERERKGREENRGERMYAFTIVSLIGKISSISIRSSAIANLNV